MCGVLISRWAQGWDLLPPSASRWPRPYSSCSWSTSRRCRSEEGHLPPQSLRQAGSTAIRANTVMAQRSLGASVACFRPGDSVRSLIDGWAYAAECILHGKPSGLDNAVACAGDAMRLSKKGGHGALSFEPVEPFPQLHVLLTNTRVPRKTSASSRASAHCMKQIHVSQHPSLRPWQRSPSRSWICAPRTKHPRA